MQTSRAYFCLLLLSLFLILLSNGCKHESAIAYPRPLPSGKLTTFLPGIVSSDSFEFNATFSPEGKTFYFARNDIHDIYQTEYNGTQWTIPTITTFSEKEVKECDPAFSPEGNTLFYISTRKKNAADLTDDFDIWFVEKQGESWSNPKNLEVVNSDSSEFYVSFSDNGNLYFASNRAGGYGSFDIYMSPYINGEYTQPVNMGDSINGAHFEHDPFISRDERFLIFTSVNREDGLGRGDLYYSVKSETGKWSKAKNLGPQFNSPDYEFCPYLTPDGKYFFLSDNKDIKWIEAAQVLKIVNSPRPVQK